MPEPLTLATAFATIVGLINIYRREKGAQEQLDHQKFIEWLEYHHHEDIKDFICNNVVLQNEVDKLLLANDAVIIEKLDVVNATLASLMSQLTAKISGLVSATIPSAQFSEQSVSILRQFVKSGSSFFTAIPMRGFLLLNLEMGGNIQYSEPMFLRDDLDKLLSAGLLSQHQTRSGEMQFRPHTGCRQVYRSHRLIVMPPRIAEIAFEIAIERHLLSHGCISVDRDGFDRGRAIFPESVLGFIRETQPKEWAKLERYTARRRVNKSSPTFASGWTLMVRSLRCGMASSVTVARCAWRFSRRRMR